MDNHAAVELRDINKRFAARSGETPTAAVEAMNLRIKHGEFFSLLGPSGCGKTTTLRMIAGFEEPTSGQVLINGQDVTGIPPFHRPVNTVFQDYALFPHMTVAQNIAFGLEMEGRSRSEIEQRVNDMLALVQLPGYNRRYPRQLSGGQQQRVALARALVKQPHVLLLDEPLGALDLKLRKQMQLELKQMQRQLGITFIYVTHDQEEALTMSDRIAVMNKGRVLQVDTAENIYERPANRFVADFIGETNFIDAVVQATNGSYATVNVGERWQLKSLPYKNNVSAESKTTVAIRPEKVELLISDAQSENCLSGVVEEEIYIGTDTRYLVRLDDQQLVVVRIQNRQSNGTHAFARGTKVNVCLPPKYALLLAE